MKLSFLALSLLGSLAVAQSLVNDCECPEVKCRAPDTLAGCRCINLAELRCKQKCPLYEPTRARVCRRPKQTSTALEASPTSTLPLPTLPILGIPGPILTVPVVAEPTEPELDVPEPGEPDLPQPDLPLDPDCECDDTFCIQSFPQSCHCQHNNAQKCYKKCGGEWPGLNTCPALDAPQPATPEPVESEPAAPEVALPDLPSTPGCECEEMMCIQSYPQSCHCQYGIKMSCYTKCGGESPGLNTCPPLSPLGITFSDGPVKRAAAPRTQRRSPIPAEPAPVPVIPPPIPVKQAPVKPAPVKPAPIKPAPIKPAPVKPAPAKPAPVIVKPAPVKPVPIVKPVPFPWKPFNLPIKPVPIPYVPIRESRRHQICGGGRPNTLACPAGEICMNDPFKTGCGLECDGLGICVKDQLCGGFAGFKCPDSRQICADIPDSCDPKRGGADCGGVCVWPLDLRTIF